MKEWTDLDLIEAFADEMSKETVVEVEVAKSITDAVNEIRWLRLIRWLRPNRRSVEFRRPHERNCRRDD